MRLFSPAKVNLLLAVTGKRKDGFHDLVSLVSPLSFGDFVTVSVTGKSGVLEFSCSDPDVPTGDANLVVRAARAYLSKVKSRAGLSIFLEKHIPMEAGLGGGSSNAATTLLILNQLWGEPLSLAELSESAVELGSDCPLFLHRQPLIMRGRGEEIELLEQDQLDRLEGLRLAVFRPELGISTPWAYRKLANQSNGYADKEAVEAKLLAWKQGQLPLSQLLMNSFESPVFEKFVAIPALFSWIEEKTGLQCLLCGSGSGCFALLENEKDLPVLKSCVLDAWGAGALFEDCRLGLDRW